MGDRDDGSGKSSQSRQRSAPKVVTESSAFGLESRHRVVSVRPRKSSQSRRGFMPRPFGVVNQP